MQKEHSPFIISFSKTLSAVFNPIFSLLIFFGVYALEKMNFQEAFKNLWLMLFIVVIPIFIWIFWNVKTGRYTNMDVSDRKQRNSLYIFNFIVIAIYISVLFFTKQKFEFTLIIIFLFILLVIMQISNFYIKSSMHTSANVFVSALFFTLNPLFGFIWLMITLLVGVSRIILKRHSPKEVMMGGLIAFLVSIVYLYININYH